MKKTDYSKDKSYYVLLDAIHDNMMEAHSDGLPADVISIFVEAIAVMIQTCIPPEEREFYAEETGRYIQELVVRLSISEDYGSDILEAAGLVR